MSHVLVIGGGAAGMMSAIAAARNGHTVTLFEKNEKCGKKIYITGKGRCNVTNASDLEVIFDNMMSNKKFLYSSFYTFTNTDLMDFFEEIGLPFNSNLYIGVNKNFPSIKLSSRSKGKLGGYRRSTNTIELDPDQLNEIEGKYVPFHEGLHW